MIHFQQDITAGVAAPPGVDRILARVSSSLGALTRRSLHTAVIAARLPTDIIESEMPAIANRSYALILHCLRTGTTPAEDSLAFLRDRAAQRAREGVPPTLLLHVWERGFQDLFEEAARAAGPDGAEALGWIGGALMRMQEMYLAELMTSYQTERDALTEERSGAAPLIARLLILGQDARSDADRLGTELADVYDVLALRLSTADPTLEPAARTVAERRRLHRISALLRTDSGPSTLTLLDRNGGHVLIPRGDDTASAPDRLDRLVAALTSASGASIQAAAVEDVPIGAIADAVGQTTEILDLVVALQHDPGLHRPADVFMAHQLSRPGPGIDSLLTSTAGVLDQPDLRSTLETYFECDFDRGRTARRLSVHPNTVNNRLNRIAELTPYSPFTVTGVTCLSAALTADRLRSARRATG